MTLIVDESELPTDLSAFQAVEAAYPDELRRACDALMRGLAVMVECDKQMTPYFFRCIRDRLKPEELRAVYLDGRPLSSNEEPRGLIATIIAQIRDMVRGSVERRLIVLPHLDLLTTSSGALTSEAKEVIPLLYENPQILWLGFKDPTFPVPRVIENLFPHQISILGVPRDRLPHLVTQREARKFSKHGFRPYDLYSHVSGVNAVGLRAVLESISGEDFPEDPEPVWRQVREATLRGDMSIPNVDLQQDIGGYASVKERIHKNILGILKQKTTVDDSDDVARMEKLIPRGIIFSGPPGTGKTYFAKAFASALGAAVQVVGGPELKSRWVGESESNLRQIFIKARQSAPSIIVFDEIDSFAAARGTYAGSGSGVEHSMVNQLLTEMDGFRDNEMVFVVGTTNFVESLDPALLRPGRFEFHIDVPYPGANDRRAILEIYNRKFALKLTEEALDYAVKRTGAAVETGGRYSGDHLHALCRTIARRRLRERLNGESSVLDVETALTENLDHPTLTPLEEKVVATHEAGHAVVGLHLDHLPPIERISIRGDVAGALGAVSYADPAHRYVVTRAQLMDQIATLFGGREAELLLLGDLSLGAAHDLHQATEIARAAVEQYGMGPEGFPVREFAARTVSDVTRAQVDAAVDGILTDQRARARALLEEHRASVVVLRDLLMEHKVVDRQALAQSSVAPR